jgi:putative flippase GtrA
MSEEGEGKKDALEGKKERRQFIQLLYFFIIIVFCWVVVDLWYNFIYNYAYNYLQLDPHSPYNSFLIASIITILIIIVLSYLGDNIPLTPPSPLN